MKTVAEVIGVSRSNLAERLQERLHKRIGRPPLPDDELIAQIKAVIAELPTYGYRRVHAILKRQPLAAGGAGDVWTWTAIDADTKLIPSWFVGGRDSDAAIIFMDDLASRLANRVQLTSDGHKAYLEAVESAFGSDIDYAMLVKLYGPSLEGEKRYSPAECIGAHKEVIEGKPDPRYISTSFAERSNLNVRMHTRRFPPIVARPAQRLWRRMHGLGWNNFEGSWPTLADVPSTPRTNHDDPWAQTLPAGWRENLDAPARPTVDENGKLILPLLVSQFSELVTVLDFGGGPAAGLANIFQYTRQRPLRVSYILVETPAMCRAVRGEIERRSGKVVEEIPDILPQPSIVNASSSLQYILDYRRTLARLARLAPKFFVVSNTPFTNCPTFARQVLNTSHRKIASWVFNRREFVAEMKALGYRPIFCVDHDLPLTHGHAPGPSIIGSIVFCPTLP